MQKTLQTPVCSGLISIIFFLVFLPLSSSVLFAVFLMSKTAQKRIQCTILYATETGKSLHFAQSLAMICKNAFTTVVSEEYRLITNKN